MFKQICDLLKASFFEEKENGYISFATDAVNVIYHVSRPLPFSLYVFLTVDG